MLKTKAIFERKTDDFQPKDCVIEKVIALTSHEYNGFSKNMLDYYDFIKDNTGLMYVDGQGIYHCVLVTGADRPNGILVQAEGYDYARYAAFLPNAADYLAAHQEQTQAQNTRQTASGLKLRDLMRIPMENIHLVHSNEKIKPMAIEELNSDTLNKAGREEWADVLDADVLRICNDNYDIQVECGGVDARHLFDFSMMLAGHCPRQKDEMKAGQELEPPGMKMNL